MKSPRKFILPFSVALLVSVLLSSCTFSRKWSKRMPPVTYSGRVIEAGSGRGVADAELKFSRPVYKGAWNFMGDWVFGGSSDLMVETTTDASGLFKVTTDSGYATYVYADKGEKSANVGSAMQNSKYNKGPLPEELTIKIKSLKVIIR